jgi:RNA polymerase sigma factor (sigma-70 family)
MRSIHECGRKGRERFRCAQAGCQECVNGLLFAHRKLVVAVVRRQWLGERAEFADLVQEGNIALWRAILGFDPERGLAFSTYAWRAIERAVWGAIKRAERGEGWSQWVRGEELALVLVEAEERREQQEALWQMVSQLPARQAGIVSALYGLESGQGQTLAAVCQRYDVTLERIRQLRNDALVQLRLPGMSSTLRQLLHQDNRTAYQRSQALNRAWLRRRRGRQP